MKYGQNQQAGDEGAVAVNHLVSREMKWIFRYVLGPDFGIDAIVEQTRGETATGRWLALQIKSGRSYFQETMEAGVVFRDSADHLEYYKNHQLPVLVVLHDPISDTAIWELVGPNVVRTGEGWKLLVPFNQTICKETAADWARLLTKRKGPKIVQTEVRLIDGSLATVHDLLSAAEEEILVAAPYISIEFLALLDFLSTRLRVRVLTSDSAIDSPLFRQGPWSVRLGLRVVPGLHARFVIADREVLCVTSANFTQRGISAAREILAIDTTRARVNDAVDQFERLWQVGEDPQGHRNPEGPLL